MIVGTYIDGRSLGYDESLYRFSVGTVPVSFQDVHAYDAAGQISWLTDELRTWFHSIDANAFAQAAAQASAQYYAPPAGDVRASAPQAVVGAPQRPSSASTTTVVVTVVAVLLLVVSMVVAIFFTTRLVSTVETDGPYFQTYLEEDDYGYGYGYGYGEEDPNGYGYEVPDQSSTSAPAAGTFAGSC